MTSFSSSANDSHEDDEIFTGTLTLLEIKKCIFLNTCRKTLPSSSKNIDKNQTDHTNNQETSLKIIETHSEPNILLKNNVLSTPLDKKAPSTQSIYWNKNDIDDSFLKIEKMVEKLSTKRDKNELETELNSTLDLVNYVLGKGPPQNTDECDINNKLLQLKPVTDVGDVNCTLEESQNNTEQSQTDMNEETRNINNISFPLKNMNKKFLDIEESHSSPCVTPVKDNIKLSPASTFVTPINKENKIPASSLKDKGLLKNKKDAFEHILSPVASYIHGCPQTPIMRNVRPKNRLPVQSSIPKLIKNTPRCNKENMNLPQVAYRSAKKTEVIHLPDKSKLPQNQWAKQITSFPVPQVMRHGHREMNLKKENMSTLAQENSFTDLPLHQADVSILVQKSAFKKP